MADRLRWSHDDLLMIGNTVVGTIEQAPNGWWYAYGCDVDWQDVDLRGHKKKSDAKRTVMSWAEERI